MARAVRCPYCHDDLGSDAGPVTACASCATSHHASCLLELGRCAVAGCARPVPADQAAALRAAGVAVRDDRRCPRCDHRVHPRDFGTSGAGTQALLVGLGLIAVLVLAVLASLLLPAIQDLWMVVSILGAQVVVALGTRSYRNRRALVRCRRCKWSGSPALLVRRPAEPALDPAPPPPRAPDRKPDGKQPEKA